jgi:hypothetical protein
MFYPITSRAVRRRKDELGRFGHIGTDPGHEPADTFAP